MKTTIKQRQTKQKQQPPPRPNTLSLIGKGTTDHDGLEIQCSPQSSSSVLTINKDTGKIISNTGEVCVNGVIYVSPVTTTEIKNGKARQSGLNTFVPQMGNDDSGYITSPEREDSINILPLLIPLINKSQKKRGKPKKRNGKGLPSFLQPPFAPTPTPTPPKHQIPVIKPKSSGPISMDHGRPLLVPVPVPALAPTKKRKRDKTDLGKVKTKKQKTTTTATTPPPITLTILPPLPQPPQKKLTQTKLKHFIQTKELCILCMAARKECINLPCNHTMACLKCTYAYYKEKSSHMKCFMCNKEVTRVILRNTL